MLSARVRSRVSVRVDVKVMCRERARGKLSARVRFRVSARIDVGLESGSCVG